MRRKKRAKLQLPAYVFPVVARGREYFYFQIGRNTANAGPRIALPRDPHSPEFWIAVQNARGGAVEASPDTFNGRVDEWLMQMRARAGIDITASSIFFYEQSIQVGRDAWGALSPRGLRPKHTQAVMAGMATRPGAANNFLSAMRTFSKWAILHEYVSVDLTIGVNRYKQEGGHKPWTPQQIEAAHTKLTGVIQKGVILYLHTGMRGSDAVRIGPEHVDEGGFALKTQKKGRDIYCPILPELEEEMKTWPDQPGPYLKQEEGRAAGKPFTRKLFSKHFAEQRDDIPELAGATLHGLRCTAVIRLRRAGLSIGQIGDIVGMSMATIERYCRNADKKQSAKTALKILKKNEGNAAIAKRRKSAKPKLNENSNLEGER